MNKIIFAVMCIFLTGCSTGTDVNEMAYVRAAAIEGDKVILSFYLDEEVLSISTDTLENAKSAAELALGKEIFTGHTELIILGQENERDILEFMLNQWKVPPACRVAYAESSREILKNRKAEEIVGVLKRAEEKDFTEKCDIVTVLGKILNGENGYLPLLTDEGEFQNRQ